MDDQIPLSEAALRLRLDYQQCRRLLHRGELAGGRDSFGRLFVTAASVERRLAVQAALANADRIRDEPDVG